MTENVLPKSLIDNPRLSAWIGFDPRGRVRVSSGKIELGQGILTALTQIAAEELDVAVERIDLVSGDTSRSPSEGSTSGSNSIAVSGSSIRIVCAEVRELLIGELAGRLGCDPARITVRDGRFLRDGADTGADYWAVATKFDLDRDVDGRFATKRPVAYRIVAANVPRLDLPAKVRGAAFIHDMAPDDLLHGRMLRQPTRAARLLSLDETAIRRAARLPVEILREGSLVAIVGADEAAVVRALAAARRTAGWEPRIVVPDAVDDPDWLRSQPADSRVVEEGHPGGAEGGTYRARFARPFLFHGSIGPSCALARFADDRLTVWSHSQDIFSLRKWIAKTLSLDLGQVDVFHRQGAGAYGHNSADDAAYDAAFVATRMPGRTVRVQWMREDEFSCAPPIGACMTVEISVSLDEGGRPSQWAIEIWSPVHGARPGANGTPNLLGAEAMADAMPGTNIKDTADAVGGGATRNARAFYDLPHHRIVHHTLAKVPVRTSSIRALGAFLNTLAIEAAMDDLAERGGEDPLAYRLSLTRDARARTVMEVAAEMSGWQSRAQHRRALGLAFSRYKNRAAYVAAVAEVEVEEEVRVKHVWASVDAGLVINPDGAESQIEGGIVQAVSWTLKEQVRFRDGTVVSSNWDSYPMLRFSEMPQVSVRFVAASHLPALGVGEAAQGPTAGAIGNAVKQALGVRLGCLPLTRERIVDALMG